MASNTDGGDPARGGRPYGGGSRRRGGKPTTIDLSASEVKARQDAAERGDEPAEPVGTPMPSGVESPTVADAPTPETGARTEALPDTSPDDLFVDGRPTDDGEPTVPPLQSQAGPDEAAAVEPPGPGQDGNRDTDPLSTEVAASDPEAMRPEAESSRMAFDNGETATDQAEPDRSEADRPTAAERAEPRRSSVLGPAAAAVIGGLIVLAGGAGLLATGVVRLGPEAEPAISAAEVASLNERLDQLTGEVGALPIGPDETLAARIDQLQAAVDNLPAQAPAGASAEDLAALQTAVQDLAARVEGLPAPSDGEATAGRLDELAATVESLRAGAEESGRTLAETAAAVDRLAAAPAVDPARVDAIATDVASLSEALAGLRTTVDDLGQRLETAQGTVTEVSDRSNANAEALAAASSRLDEVVARLDAGPTGGEIAALSLAVTTLATKVAAGEPFAADLAVVRTVAPDLPGLDRLEPAAEDGVRTTEQLAATLPADEILASRQASADGGVVDRLFSGAKSLVNYRETGEAAGDPVAAAVASLEAALASGDLQAAEAAAAAIPQDVRATEPGWFAALDRRLAAETAVSAMTDQLLERLRAPAEGR